MVSFIDYEVLYKQHCLFVCLWTIPIVSLIFPDNLVEKRMSEITILDVDALALTLLVDFAYT